MNLVSKSISVVMLTFPLALLVTTVTAGEKDLPPFLGGSGANATSICLSSTEPKDKLADKKNSANMTYLTIGLERPAGASGVYDASMKFGFKDSKGSYTIALYCLQEKGDSGLSCFPGCGDGFELELRAVNGGNVEARVNVANEYYKDSTGTASKTETLELIPVDMQLCKPDPV